MRILLFGLFLVSPASLLADTPATSNEGIAWLQKIATAAHELNYSGTFIYQYGSHVETSRIVHAVDSSGEHEKLEILNGLPREIVRNNDEVQCFLPSSKTVRVEKRLQRKPFPALLPEELNDLNKSYLIKLGDRERIAGFDCQTLLLEPKDGLRYGHRLWAESNSGLLLKASMLDEHNDVVEQMEFTQLNIGGPIDEEMLKPKYPVKTAGWHYDLSPQAEPISTESGWDIKSPLAGFRKILDAKRTISGKSVPISHIVYSDGLAAVSIFIEPLAAGDKPRKGVSKRGALNIYARPLDDYQVTVLGEVPMMTVMELGNSVYPTGK